MTNNEFYNFVKCFLKFIYYFQTSDVQADETARQEKLKERVDEWMSSMVNRMKILDEPPTKTEDDTTDANKRKSGLDPSVVNGENSKWSDSTSGRSSPIVPKYKEELEEIRRKSELEQMQRIRKRAQVFSRFFVARFSMSCLKKVSLVISFATLSINQVIFAI